jgi:outer membrane protein assembly factor BamB
MTVRGRRRTPANPPGGMERRALARSIGVRLGGDPGPLRGIPRRALRLYGGAARDFPAGSLRRAGFALRRRSDTIQPNMRRIDGLQGHPFGRALAAAIVILVSWSASPHPAAAGGLHVRGQTDWPQFRFDAMRSGNNPFEQILSPSTVAGLVLDWTGETGFVQSSASVVGGIVYIGSDEGGVHAFDADSGAKLWTAPTNGPVLSSPAVWGGLVFAITFGTGGQLLAFDAATGAKKWKRKLGFSSSSPLVADGVVYVGAEQTLLAFDALTGSPIWRSRLSDSSSSSPTLAGQVLYVGVNHRLVALDAATGGLLWSAPTGGEIVATPAVVQGVAYVGSFDDHLYAFDAASGDVLWKAPTGDDVYASAAVGGGVVYVMSIWERTMFAFDASTGAERWHTLLASSSASSPSLANGVVYIGAVETLYALRARTGEILWTGATGGTIGSSPTVVNGSVFVGSADDGALYSFALPGPDALPPTHG